MKDMLFTSGNIKDQHLGTPAVTGQDSVMDPNFIGYAPVDKNFDFSLPISRYLQSERRCV